MKDNFPMGDGFRMIQMHYIHCSLYFYLFSFLSFPGGSDSKEPDSNAGDLCSIPGSRDSLEREMATHTSILAWRIPWTEKPDRLQSMGLQRVGHN